MRFIFWLIIFIGLFLFGIRYIERNSIYFPMRDMHTTPQQLGLDYEDIYFTTSDNKTLNGWYIPNKDARFTVIFCHGNAGNISHRIEKIAILHRLGLGIFIFDYRGYGKSQGRPSEQGLYKDASGAYNYLKERNISKDNIILYGESIGASVAIDLASREKVKAIITEEAFPSIKDMAKIAYPFLPHFIFRSRFNSLSKIKEITCDKLIIHSVDDEIVPFYLGEKLYKEASPPKKFLKIRGSHNTAFLEEKEKFSEGIKLFLKDL